MFGRTHEARPDVQVSKGGAMFGNVPLQGENADFHLEAPRR